MAKVDYESLGFTFKKPDMSQKKRAKDMFMDSGDSQYEEVSIYDMIPNPDNRYPMTEIGELAESIKQYGLQHNIVLKARSDGKYDIIAGHRRQLALINIVEEDNEYGYLEMQTCLVASQREDPIITNLKKHITNTDVRSLLQMNEKEKLEIVEDYMYWLEQAREANIEINGKSIKGKTRDLIAERFGIAKSTAGELIRNIKNSKGAEIGTPHEELTRDEEIERITSKVSKQLSKIYNSLSDVTEDLQPSQKDELKRWLTDIDALLK